MATIGFEIDEGNGVEDEEDDYGHRMVELRPSEPGLNSHLYTFSDNNDVFDILYRSVVM